MSQSDRRAALDEKRAFPRVDESCRLRWRAMDEEGKLDEFAQNNRAVMNNISGGGISFRSAEPVPENRMLALEVELPGFPQAVSMGKVAWSRRQDDGSYEVGVEFWWIGWRDEDAQSRIRGFITESLKKDDA